MTFKKVSHLNGKHTVFGKVVKGFDTLDKMENVKTENGSKPVENIIIQDTIVISNPYRTVV
jgi:cyclophilin family peptidyl-prolyl cis-trans isomerase